MAANNKSGEKHGVNKAIARELDQLRKKVKELTGKLESEMKARKINERVAAEAKKARDQLNKQIRALSDQGGKMAAQLKSTMSDASKREQALKEARDKVKELRADVSRKAAELKHKTQELTKIAVESAHRAAAVMRGNHEAEATGSGAPQAAPPPTEPGAESTNPGDEPKAF